MAETRAAIACGLLFLYDLRRAIAAAVRERPAPSSTKEQLVALDAEAHLTYAAELFRLRHGGMG